MTPSLEIILEAVSAVYRLPVAKIVGPRRKALIVDARITVALIAFRFGYNQDDIATALNRDRTTPYHYAEVGGHRLETERVFGHRCREALRLVLRERNRLVREASTPKIAVGVPVCG